MEIKEKYYDFSPEELRRAQLKQLEMYVYFKDFCQKHGITFFFCGGCCIGTLRHGGFIPWDDDIDVFMPRDDYERLYELWQKEEDNSRFELLRTTPERFCGNIFMTLVDKHTTCIKPYQKELDIPHGYPLDILPLDGCPEGFARKKQKLYALVYSLFCAQVVPQTHGKAVSLAAKALLGIFRGQRVRAKIWQYCERKMTKYRIQDCEKITELCSGPYYMRNEYPKRAFESAVYKPFEGIDSPIPVGYDEYLKMAFGDYMTLPPKEKQKPHHDTVFADSEAACDTYRGIYFLTEERKK